MVDKALILRKLAELEEYLGQIREYTNITMVGYLGRKLGGHKIKVVAQHFNRDPVVIGQGIKGLENKVKDGKGFAKTMISIKKSLIRNSSRKILIYNGEH